MKKSILGLCLVSSLLMADFIRDDVKEVVNDTITCLMWQDDNAAKTVTKTWQKAIDHCEDMTLSGYEDWRLPNFNELYSIGDRSKYKPAIKDAFVNVSSNYYWSSTTYVSNSSDAWYVSFDYGNDGNYYKTYNYYVRCVRDGQ